MTSRGVFSRKKHIRGVCFSFVQCVSDFTGGGGGFWWSFFGLNCVKSRNFRQNKHGNRSLNTVNVVIFAGGKFREYVCTTFHVGVIFTILLLFPSYRHMGLIFA